MSAWLHSWPWKEACPELGNSDIPGLTQNPKCATSLGRATVWLVVACWEWAKDTVQSAREFPLVHLPPTQEMVAAKRQCCAIKVFVKKLSWALWAILRALFRLAVSGGKKQHSVWRQTRASVEGVAWQRERSWEAGPLGSNFSNSTNLLCDFG